MTVSILLCLALLCAVLIPFAAHQPNADEMAGEVVKPYSDIFPYILGVMSLMFGILAGMILKKRI